MATVQMLREGSAVRVVSTSGKSETVCLTYLLAEHHAMALDEIERLHEENAKLRTSLAELLDAANDAVMTHYNGGMPGGPIMRLRAAINGRQA